MGYNAAPLEKLIEEFSKFPGIGRKGATRMAYQVLSMSDVDAAALAGAIQNAHTKLPRCRVCQNYTEAELCPICASAKRDRSVICVVETPRDVQAFERTREYHGLYHVLHGLISPVDGIGLDLDGQHLVLAIHLDGDHLTGGAAGVLGSFQLSLLRLHILLHLLSLTHQGVHIGAAKACGHSCFHDNFSFKMLFYAFFLRSVSSMETSSPNCSSLCRDSSALEAVFPAALGS